MFTTGLQGLEDEMSFALESLMVVKGIRLVSMYHDYFEPENECIFYEILVPIFIITMDQVFLCYLI